MSWFTDDLGRIDAAVFSGDALESLDNRKELKAMCERWLRAITSHGMPTTLSISNPICPHCQKPVLFEHSPTAVMILGWNGNQRTSTGPYHGECAKIIAQHTDDQAWDRRAEHLTDAALGTNKGYINMQAKSVDDIFFDACVKCRNPQHCAQRGSCIDRDASAPAMPQPPGPQS